MEVDDLISMNGQFFFAWTEMDENISKLIRKKNWKNKRETKSFSGLTF